MSFFSSNADIKIFVIKENFQQYRARLLKFFVYSSCWFHVSWICIGGRAAMWIMSLLQQRLPTSHSSKVKDRSFKILRVAPENVGLDHNAQFLVTMTALVLLMRYVIRHDASDVYALQVDNAEAMCASGRPQ